MTKNTAPPRQASDVAARRHGSTNKHNVATVRQPIVRTGASKVVWTYWRANPTSAHRTRSNGPRQIERCNTAFVRCVNGKKTSWDTAATRRVVTGVMELLQVCVDTPHLTAWNEPHGAVCNPPNSRHQERRRGQYGPGVFMSTETQINGAAAGEPGKASRPSGIRRRDSVDEPARPLGKKRAALQAQRRRSPMRVESVPAACKIVSTDATLAFGLRRTPSGLLVERSHCPRRGARVVQTMLFDSASGFDRWCDSEPVRFENPLLHAQLRREGHAVLDGER